MMDFNPLPSYEGRRKGESPSFYTFHFNPLPSYEGRRLQSRRAKAGRDFNPLPSYEGRRATAAYRARRLPFQSTPLIRGETPAVHQHDGHQRISIHSPHTRGDDELPDDIRVQIISIHSPHTRGDISLIASYSSPFVISIHSPHTRGDRRRQPDGKVAMHFNPLPSYEGRQHKPPKIHPNLRQLTQQNHDTPLFGALQAPFCGAEPDIRGAERLGKP